MVHDLPGEVLAPLTELLLDSLRVGAGDHDRAEFLLQFLTPARPGPVSYTDGVLRAVDDQEIDFVDWAAAWNTIKDTLSRSQALNVPVRTLHFAFTRTAQHWTSRVAVETLADYLAFRPALKALQERVAAGLMPLLGQAWTTVSLSRYTSLPQPDRLLVDSTGHRQRTEPPPALRHRLDEVQALLLANRRTLRVAVIRIAGQPDDVLAAGRYYYGLQPA